MNVELIDADSGTDVWIDQALVDAGIAKKTEKPVQHPSCCATMSAESPEKISFYLPG